MKAWNVAEIESSRHHPTVLDSENEGRAIVIDLPAGERSRSTRCTSGPGWSW